MNIDIAIVTALKIERDAILSRLDEVEFIKEDLEPQPYYQGYVNIPGSTERYSVIVMLLLEMGNDEAASATTALLHRWHPASVFMVGIAGGVKGEVELGDVVVAKYVYYYELAKLTSSGEQRRSEQFPSDTLLRSRAYTYEETEWKSRISVTRPGSQSSKDALPKVYFAPIASGEKVIANADAIQKLLQDCPKMVAVAMEGAGVARAASRHRDNPRFIEIRGICDFADPSKNDDWHSYAANSAAAFTIGLLHDRPLPVLTTVSKSAKKSDNPIVLLCAQSLQNQKIAPDEILSELDIDLQERPKEFISIDLTTFTEGGVFTDPASAVKKLTDPLGALASAISRSNEADFVFHGLAHIPMLVLMGHIFSDRIPVRLFDFHPSPGSNSWAWPDNDQSFPRMDVYGLPGAGSWQSHDVVLRVSVTYEISAEQTLAVVPGETIEIDLKIASPTRSVIRCEEQVQEYGRVFRRILDLIAQNLPTGQKVHLFYAGQAALGFHLGQQISENIHPEVTVWNYHRGYDWAINLADAYLGKECIVRSPVSH